MKGWKLRDLIVKIQGLDSGIKELDMLKKAQEHCDSSFTTVFIDLFDFYKFYIILLFIKNFKQNFNLID